MSTKADNLPTKSPMRWRILFVVGALYAAQFIPLFFAIMALPIILRLEGHSATTIGLVQLATIPYLIKFLWAPLIDKYRLGANRYKSWIVLLSALHIASVGVLSLTDPGGNLLPVVVALAMAVLAISTQDVAVDALVISLLRPSERSMGSTLQNAGAHGGAVVGGFGFLYIYDTIGWTAALLIQAVVFVIPLFSLLFVDEPPRLRGAPPVTMRGAWKFFTQPKIGKWLAVLATMRLPILITMLPIRLMMVDQGMTTQEIAVWFGLFAMSAGGGATVLFGALLRNLPRVQAIYVVGLLNIPVLLLVAFIAASVPSEIRYALVIAWAALAMTDVVMFRGAMDKVRPEIPGFDFSVQIAIYFLLPGFLDPLTGYAMDTVGSLPVFIIAIPLALLPLGILYFSIATLRNSAQGLDGERAVSTGHMQAERPLEVMQMCEEKFGPLGIDCTWPKSDFLHMESMGCIVEMKRVEGALDVKIDTPTENYLIFIREEVIDFLEEFYPDEFQTMRWTGGFKAGEMPSNFRVLRAVRRQKIHPGLIRVTLQGIDVEAMIKDGIHIRIMMPEQREREPVWPIVNESGMNVWPKGDDTLHSRWVTVRNVRLDEREIDVDIAHHDGGLISDWAALEGDDQKVGVMGPAGDPGLDETKNVILAADATGLPAIARLIESVEGRVTGHVFCAAPSQEVLEDYLPKSRMIVEAIDPAEFSRLVAERIKSCTKDPVSYGWFGGEFEAAQAVRSVFKKTFGLNKHTQMSLAFWREGMPGHESRAV
ncbi:MAG: MFS transporter [Pseudomonadota bacterium]